MGPRKIQDLPSLLRLVATADIVEGACDDLHDVLEDPASAWRAKLLDLADELEARTKPNDKPVLGNMRMDNVAEVTLLTMIVQNSYINAGFSIGAEPGVYTLRVPMSSEMAVTARYLSTLVLRNITRREKEWQK